MNSKIRVLAGKPHFTVLRRGENFVYSHVSVGTSISVEKEIEEVSFGLSTAIPLGFLITELVSNCLKHAFPDREGGTISVILRALDKWQYELVVSHNGVGFSDHVDFNLPPSMGTDFIDTFVQQLHGRH
jgi:two-component sensor histidine kinase